MTRSRFPGRSLLCAAFVTLLAGSALAAPAAKPAGSKPATAKHATPASAAALPSPSAPFWAGAPDGPRFQAIQRARIAKAKTLIAQMVAAKGVRTTANTLQPYDDALNLLDQAAAQCELMENVSPAKAVRDAAAKMTQAVAAYQTEISLDRHVYDALKALKPEPREEDDAAYYVAKEMRDFRLAGVDKDEATRKEIRKLRDSIVVVGQDFDRNIREDSRTFKVKPGDLAGLPQDWLDAHKPGADGMVELSIEYPDYFPVMTYATNPDARRRMYLEAQNRAYPRNMAVLDSLIRMRDRLSHLVGFDNYADYDCADRMIESGRNARNFINRVVQASGTRMQQDYSVLLARKKKDDPSATGLVWWDRFYYTNLVKKEQYDFDTQALRPYFPYDRVKQGVLDVTSKMFGVTYRRIANAPVWDPAVECWEMDEDGKLVGRFYLDMHPRRNKFNHAAQFDIRTGVEGRQIPEAALVCNLPGGKAGDPGLCDFDDVNTFFHEFGHLLHNLFAGHQRWCGLGGIRTEADFIEAPSQMLEEWMRDPKVLQVFAKHYETGEPVPQELIAKMRRADEFGDIDPKGIGIRRQMVLADLSLSIYDRPPSGVNTDSLNARLTRAYTPYPYVADTHMQTSFGHLYGYGAAYYTYMWSLVIAKDMFTQFDPNDLLDPKVAKRYRDAVLAPGGSRPAAVLVKNFMHREPGFDAFERWLNKFPESSMKVQ